jgi:hypothetical protein
MLIPLVVSKLCPGQEKQTDGQSGDFMLTLPKKKTPKTKQFVTEK